MLDSLILTLTTCAVALLVPAAVVLVGSGTPGRHSHAADDGSAGPRARGSRLAVVASGVGLGSLGIALLAGAGPVLGSVVAAILAGSVVAWSRQDGGTWSVRGVTAWALGVAALVGLLALLGLRVLEARSWAATAVGGLAWLVLLPAAYRLLGPARARCAMAGRRPVVAGPHRPGRAVSLAAVVAAGAVAVLLGATTATVGPATDNGPSQAGEGETRPPSKHPEPSVDPSLSGSASGRESAGRTPSSTPTSRRTSGAGDGVGGAARTPSGDSVGGPTRSEQPSPTSPTGSPAKTPGYLKEKPNRPEDAPSPGRGRHS